MADIYYFYHDLKWTERKLVRDDPFIEVDYIEGDVEEDHISLLPNDFSTEVKTVLQKEVILHIFFVIDVINKVIDVTEGIQEVLDTIILKRDD